MRNTGPLHWRFCHLMTLAPLRPCAGGCGMLSGYRGGRSPRAEGPMRDADPRGLWCKTVCPLVFASFIAFWQDVRWVLRLGSRLVFVDRFCTDQSDSARKGAGILGLAGSLACTGRLVICWTPNLSAASGALARSPAVFAWQGFECPVSRANSLMLQQRSCLVPCASAHRQ